MAFHLRSGKLGSDYRLQVFSVYSNCFFKLFQKEDDELQILNE